MTSNSEKERVEGSEGRVVFCILLALFMSGCEPYKTETVRVESVVVAKQIGHAAINAMGAQEEHYYILYENGDLKDVPLRTFMSTSVGDTMYWNVTYRID